MKITKIIDARNCNPITIIILIAPFDSSNLTNFIDYDKFIIYI